MVGDVLIFGPPGSGKGTQARLMCEKLGFHVVSTGDILRSRALSSSDHGIDAGSIKSLMDSGSLLPDEFVFGIVQECLWDYNSAVVFDGFPRNLVQARMLSVFYDQCGTGRSLKIVVEFVVDDEMLWARVSSRYICKDCGAVRSVFVNGDASVCHACGGSRFESRFDDNKAVFDKRLADYKDFMVPLRSYYESLLEYIDADGTVESVFLKLLRKLEKLS